MNIWEFREFQRIQMVARTSRSSITGLPLCHFCGIRSGAQMHELVNRAQTSSNKDALRLSYSEELCSWLCPECHERASVFDYERFLWRRNTRVYGYDAVYGKLRELEQALGFWPIVEFEVK